MFKRIRSWLRTSQHFHVREHGVNDLESLLGVLDRFIDGTPRYALEWDDFISWEHPNENIERVRIRIADLEPLFFSTNADDRNQAATVFFAERNAVATRLDRESRQRP